jgi:ATP-dependent 26S proteasome regulatory subunit
MPKPKKPTTADQILADASVPVSTRLECLRHLLMNLEDETAQASLAVVLEKLRSGDASAEAAAHAKELESLLEELREGPLRPGVFMGQANLQGSNTVHAHVKLDDGQHVCAAVPEPQLALQLRSGDGVLVDSRGRAVLFVMGPEPRIGEQARLERRLDRERVEVTLSGGCVILRAAHRLVEQLDAGQAEAGAALIVSTRHGIAWESIPLQNSLSHYRYRVTEPVPDVLPHRDIGSPPRMIEEIGSLLRQELTRPELRRALRLKRCSTRILTGTTGSGKSLAIRAVWRRMYEIMSEATGVPIEQLPPRVFRCEPSQLLSKWLGESDQNIARFFTEVEQCAAEPYTTPDGRTVILPVLVIIEEADGLAQERGHESIHDRLLTTLLQRLDPSRPEWKERPIVVLASTNEPGRVDRAFLRRIGGKVVRFGRLDKRAFVSVLLKHLDGRPLERRNGHAQPAPAREVAADLAAWMFAPNANDASLVELLYAGSTTPDVRSRRHFLTGALVASAVDAAAEAAAEAHLHAASDVPIITLAQLMRAFDDQIRALVDLLDEHNARHYLDLPDGVRVATVRRLPQPHALAIELHRNSPPSPTA